MANTDPTGYLSISTELIRGLQWKRPVRVATTANITLSGTQTIDGVACVAGDRVLAKNQTTGSQNGIWIVAAGAWTRAFDFDQDLTTAVPAEETMGAIIFVLAGTVNGGTIWKNTNTTAPVLGTTALTFSNLLGSVSVALDDLTDVTITSAATGDRLRFDGSVWVNSALIWKPVMDGSGNVVTDSGTGEAIMAEVAP